MRWHRCVTLVIRAVFRFMGAMHRCTVRGPTLWALKG